MHRLGGAETKVSDVTRRGRPPSNPRVKANGHAASAFVRPQLTKINIWTQQNNLVEVQAQSTMAFKHFARCHSDSDETMGSMSIVRASLLEKTAYFSKQLGRRIKIEEALLASKVAKPFTK